jgi:hypothetical protein
VLSDEAGVVTRDVVFKPGMGPKPQARETVKSYYPSWVRFSPLNNLDSPIITFLPENSVT